MFDPQKGEFHRDHAGQSLQRPLGSRPPCQVCPKVAGLPADQQTPEEGSRSDLSKKNRQTLDRYYEHRAAPLAGLDAVARHNFGLIERTIAEHERWEARRSRIVMELLAARGR